MFWALIAVIEICIFSSLLFYLEKYCLLLNAKWRRWILGLTCAHVSDIPQFHSLCTFGCVSL